MSGKGGVHIATHPLIAHKITHLRDKNTAPQQFRVILQEVTFYLGYEATRDLTLSEHTVTTPNESNTTGHKINQSISLIPILRAGLGMTEGMLNLIPNASIHHIGMYRTRESLMPGKYSLFYNLLRSWHFGCYLLPVLILPITFPVYCDVKSLIMKYMEKYLVSIFLFLQALNILMFLFSAIL